MNSAHQGEAICTKLDGEVQRCAQTKPGCEGAVGATTAEAYACAGFFASSPKWCAALNRGMLDDPDNPDTSQYYVNDPYSVYAKWVHQTCPGIYAFPYDDYPSNAGERVSRLWWGTRAPCYLLPFGVTAIARYACFSGRADNMTNVDLLGADGELTELGLLPIGVVGFGCRSFVRIGRGIAYFDRRFALRLNRVRPRRLARLACVRGRRVREGIRSSVGAGLGRRHWHHGRRRLTNFDPSIGRRRCFGLVATRDRAQRMLPSGSRLNTNMSKPPAFWLPARSPNE